MILDTDDTSSRRLLRLPEPRYTRKTWNRMRLSQDILLMLGMI